MGESLREQCSSKNVWALRENYMMRSFITGSCFLSVCLSLYIYIYLSICVSIYLKPFVGPWPLFSFLILYTQSVGTLRRGGGGISPSQDLYLYTEQHKHKINAHTDIHVSSGIPTHNPSVRAGENISCLRPHGHCDRLICTASQILLEQSRKGG
jgi:hypothetical protein